MATHVGIRGQETVTAEQFFGCISKSLPELEFTPEDADIVFQLMNEADLDDSNESSVEETSQADAETAVTEQNLKKLSI